MQLYVYYEATVIVLYTGFGFGVMGLDRSGHCIVMLSEAGCDIIPTCLCDVHMVVTVGLYCGHCGVIVQPLLHCAAVVNHNLHYIIIVFRKLQPSNVLSWTCTQEQCQTKVPARRLTLLSFISFVNLQ